MFAHRPHSPCPPATPAFLCHTPVYREPPLTPAFENKGTAFPLRPFFLPALLGGWAVLLSPPPPLVCDGLPRPSTPAVPLSTSFVLAPHTPVPVLLPPASTLLMLAVVAAAEPHAPAALELVMVVLVLLPLAGFPAEGFSVGKWPFMAVTRANDHPVADCSPLPDALPPPDRDAGCCSAAPSATTPGPKPAPLTGTPSAESVAGAALMGAAVSRTSGDDPFRVEEGGGGVGGGDSAPPGVGPL